MKHSIQEELKGVLAFVGAIWVVFALEFVSPVNLKAYGVTPRTSVGLIGIGTMPFLHADWQHITSNTPPLLVLLVLLAGSRANSWATVTGIILLGGALLWLFGRTATHIGAKREISQIRNRSLPIRGKPVWVEMLWVGEKPRIVMRNQRIDEEDATGSDRVTTEFNLGHVLAGKQFPRRRWERRCNDQVRAIELE